MDTVVRERPILFSGPMVRAILDGRKTQTRRVVKPQPNPTTRYWGQSFKDPALWTFGTDGVGEHDPINYYVEQEARCPFGQPGDRLWVREAWKVAGWHEGCPILIGYADGETHEDTNGMHDSDAYEDWAFRVALQSGEDCEKAGTPTDEFGVYESSEATRWRPSIHMPRWASRLTLEVTGVRVERLQSITDEDIHAEGAVAACEEDLYQSAFADEWFGTPRRLWRHGWDALNAKRGYGWEANPWVWVVEFKRV